MAKIEMEKSSLDLGGIKGNPDTKKEKVIKPVVKNQVTEKNRSAISKFRKILIGGSLSETIAYLRKDVLVPKLQETIVEAVDKGTDMLVYGEDAPVRSRKQNKGIGMFEKVSYHSSSATPKRRAIENASKKTRDFRDLVFETKEDAQNVLDSMLELIDQYEEVSINDLYDLVNRSGNFTDNKYGWTNLSSAKIVRTRVDGAIGWVLDLPPAIYLNE